MLAAIIAIAVIAASMYVCYGFSERLAPVPGKTDMTVIMRLTAFLFVCVGVQIAWSGLRTLLSPRTSPELAIPGLLPGHERSVNHVRHSVAANRLDRQIHVFEPKRVRCNLLQRKSM